MKRYEKYKDSGVEWIGEIPEEWEVKRIKYIANIFGRIGFRGYTVEDIVDEGEGAITLSPSNIVNQRIVLDKRTFLSWNKYEESPEIKIYNEDVIFVKTASVGKVAYVENLNECATLNPQIIVFKNIKLNNKFLYYNLISDVIQSEIIKGSSGSVLATLTQNEIGNYILVTPTIEEQTQIVTYLDNKISQLEAFISKKQELIETLKASRTKLISEIVTKGLNKDVEMKDSGVEWIGEIPRHWEVSKLKFVTNLISIKLENYRFNKYIGLEHVEQCSGKLIDYGDPSELESKINSVFYKNNILFGKLRPYLTKCIVTETEGVCSDEFLVLESDKLVPKFLKFIMLNKVFINLVNAATYGAKMPRASWDFVGNIKVSYPNKKEQQAIATYLDHKTSQIDNLISKIEKQITLLKKAKEKLITEVVTGKINVTDL